MQVTVAKERPSSEVRLRLLAGGSGQPSSCAPWWRRIAPWLRKGCGRLAHSLRLPGAIRPTVVNDPVTGRRIEVAVDAFYVTINIDGRDFYFRRCSGAYDGTGAGCP